MIKLAYNSNGLRLLPLEAAVELVARTGYEGLELSLHQKHLHPWCHGREDAQALKRALVEHNVVLSNVHSGAQDALSADPFEPSLITMDPAGRALRIRFIKAAIDLAEDLGSPSLTLTSGFVRDDNTRDNAWALLRQGLAECLSYASNRIGLLVEPEPGMLVETHSDLVTLREELRDDRVCLNLDVGHAYCTGGDPAAVIHECADIMHHVHVEDIRERKHCHEIPGTGDMDWTRILAALKDVGYDGFLSVELYNHGHMPRRAMEQSIVFLTQIMAQIA